MKKYIAIFIVVIILLLVSCGDSFNYYIGDRYDLLTVAVHSILGACGYTWHNDAPTIEVVEEDEYGRVLFRYTDPWATGEYSLLISQKADCKHVYYYPDYNFITNASGVFADEDVYQLKALNDWNKEFDDSKMIRKEISDRKIGVDIDYEKVENAIIGCCAKISIKVSTFNDYTFDDYGRTMYYLTPERSEHLTNDDVKQDIYVIILSADLTYDEKSIIKIEDQYNYQHSLRDFKDLNGWNQPN